MNHEERILDLLEQLTARVDTLTGDMTTMKSDMATMKSDMVTMKSDMATMKSDMSELKTRVTKIEVTQENVVLPRIQLLMEGQNALREQISRLSVVDRLQDDVTTLKSAVRYLSEKVEKLEQAM